jgi:hypothetical protein
MGLDISYGKLGNKIEVDDNIERWSEEFYKKYGGDIVWLNNWDGFHQGDDLDGEYYEIEFLGGFRAGSYSGYGWFRDTLMELAGLAMSNNKELDEKYGGGTPFYDLVEFSDCEGFIGPFTSAKLAEEFKDFEDEIVEKTIRMVKYGLRPEVNYEQSDLDYFKMKYLDWKEAFEKVSNIGVVLFG